MHAHNPPTHPRPYAALGTGFYRRLGTLLASISLLAFAALALSASPALAEVVHPYRTQLTGTPTGPGGAEVPFGDVCGVAVDPATQDLYVADPDNNVIDVFSSAGKYERQISGAGIPSHEFGHTGAAYHGEEVFGGACSVAVSDKTGDLYVAEAEAVAEGVLSAIDPGNVYVFNSKGEYLKPMTGSFQSPHVAIDQSSGDVYVSNPNDEVIDVFNEKNEYQREIEFAITGAVDPWALATNSSGDVYVTALVGGGGVYEFSSLGSEIAQFGVGLTGDFLFGVAVDSEGNVYALQTRHVYNEDGGVSAVVDEFDSAGTLLHQTTGTPSGPDDRNPQRPFGYSEGVAVNAAGELYLADASSHVVDVFGTAVFLAKVTSAPASGVTDTSAVLHGLVDPEGVAVTECSFEYGETEEYGKDAPCERTPGAGSAEVPVNTATLPGLKPSTVYHYRLTATNANGTNYASDGTARTTGPPTVDAQSAENLTKTTEHVEAEVNPSGFATEVYVQYGETTGYGSKTAPVDIGSGTTDQNVSFELTGLHSGTTYHYRIVASNSQNPPGEPTDGPDATFTTVPPVLIGEQSSSASSASAELSAQVNDLETASTYFFEYGTSESCFATESCSKTPVESLAGSSKPLGVSAHVEGLQPDTLYYFRVVVTNQYSSPGTVAGPPADFSTLALGFLGLPDGRVFEMVTPPDNENADVSSPPQGLANTDVLDVGAEGASSTLPFQASADGDAVSYAGDPGATGGTGEDGQNLYFASRLPEGGWSQVNISTGGSSLAFAGGLSLGRLTNAGTSTVPAFSHFLSGGEGNVLYDETGGQSYPVSVLPDGETTSEAVFGTPNVTEPHQDDGRAVVDRAISADGSRIFFSTAEAKRENGRIEYGPPKALYVRENDTSTVQVDKAQPGAEGPSGGGLFWTASSDGSRVFFTDCSRLTKESTAVFTPGCGAGRGGRLSGSDLYEYDVETGGLTDLSVALDPAEPAEVQGVVGSSENGEYVYFAAGGVLGDGAAKGAVPQTCQPPTDSGGTYMPGTPCNLYLRHDGATSFVVALSPGANEVEPAAGAGFGMWEQSLGDRTAEVSADGGLVFSVPPENGKNDQEYVIGGVGGGGGDEVYVYSAETGRLTCVSCSPSVEVSSVGGRPQGVGAAGGWLPATGDESNAAYQQRFISEDGDRVFFDSFSDLVPQDRGGRNVFEWERDGTGSCTENPGCVYLLSGGTSQAGSSFLDASANGNDVFVITRAQLTPADENDAYNVFDARVDGAQPPVKTECQGTGCQGVPPAPPIFATPSSATITGAEAYEPGGRESNPPKKVVKKTVKCKRGFVKKKNKCVRNKKKKTKAKKATNDRRTNS